ncbi:DUF1003 domain-containing protein [Comamonas sp.]|uniref:DUF1003 domain-containing protein n=1 Tax=Comamonas sp. TaxID=34028 RepID=UPI002FC5E7EB
MHRKDTAPSAQPTDSLNPLDARARKVVEHITHRRHISRNVSQELDRAPASFGERAADAVAGFGGSWKFVILFVVTMLLWVSTNVLLLAWQGHTFDPYPFILLNLVLSMLAAIQAPVILMAQNRQADKDRAHSAHDYEVNLKAELEIMMLHDKIDQLQNNQWNELIALQREQLHLLTSIVEQRNSPQQPS